MKRTILCALLAGCGGLPLPTHGATRCAANVYLEAGVGAELTCEGALAMVATTLRETGVDVTREAGVVEFMVGADLGSLGQPTAWGLTESGSIAVVSAHANTLIHEALHLHDMTHCNWSKPPVMPILERNAVAGSFDDKCAHLHCTSTRLWFRDGQWFGDTYQCTPIP